jgi:hypothetical protein
MNEVLSKSDFLKYHTCPSYFWLWIHKRDLIQDKTAEEVRENRFEQGNEVEKCARQLFPVGKLVSSYGEQAKEMTRQFIKDGVNVIFQATVLTDNGLLAMADILEKDGDGWKLYEVKSTNEIKKDKHIPDTAFQRIAFEKAGYKITSVNIIHMNKTFVRSGDLMDVHKLMVSENVDDLVDAILPEIKDEISLALDKMRSDEEPTTCPCRLLSRGQHCSTFAYFNPDIPKYSVYDISRMQGRKLAELIDSEIFEVADVPDDFPLNTKQKTQVDIEKSGKIKIDKAAIKDELDSLEFPLYFLDYESVNPALPFMDGSTPYQQIIFQYSLHILDAPNTEPRHTEFLSRDGSIKSLHKLVESLQDNIGNKGSIIVWNKSFECCRNREVGRMIPEFANFMDDVNSRVYDLMDIFSKNYYVDPLFHGSNSIKDVLPVLAPQLSYKELNINKGDIASVKWFDVTIGSNREEAEQVYADLLVYCGLDTLAMVEIYNVLIANLN